MKNILIKKASLFFTIVVLSGTSVTILLSGCVPTPPGDGSAGAGGLGTGSISGSVGSIKESMMAYQQAKDSYKVSSGNFIPANIQVNPAAKLVKFSGINVTLTSVSAKGPASGGVVNLQASISKAKTGLLSGSVLNKPIFSIACGTPISGNMSDTGLSSSNAPMSVDLSTLTAVAGAGAVSLTSRFEIDLAPLKLPDMFQENGLIMCWIPEAKI